ncbi:MAG: chaperonin GroEL [Dehalococcoidia bacterium]|nr:chaperonin GroEL [Dehalococcoidia bacterium]
MAKILAIGEEARNKLRDGMDVLARAVKVTLGPRGRNVILDKKFGPPIVCSDGVTIAKEIELTDIFENMGAQLIKVAASKTNDVVGDGTTTSVVLAQAIVHEGFKNVAAGADPMVLKRGLDKALEVVKQEIKRMAKPVAGKDQIAQVAILSAHETETGMKIAEAMDKVGKDGVITVEESRGLGLEVEYVDGMDFDQGYVSPYFITNQDRAIAEVENPYILIADKSILTAADILPTLEKLIKVTKNLVIVAADVEGEALATLVVNKLHGALNVLAVKASGFGDRRKDLLEDLAILTGGHVISEEAGRKLDAVTLQDLGRARRVISEKDRTTIVEGKGAAAAIQERMKQLQLNIDRTTSDYDKEKLQERLAKLSGGVAVIRVGGTTEVELKERKIRAEDALSATKAAVEEGIIPGGGVVFVRAQAKLDEFVKQLEGDERTGALILRNALEVPLRTIAENAGQPGQVILEEVRKHQDDYAFNAETMKFGHMLEQGIIDPAKVARAALENSVSVASMILTTESLISDEPLPPGTPALPPME